MNKFLIILTIALVSSEFVDSDRILFQQFQKFIKKYNKSYNSVNEFLSRFEIFKENAISNLKENPSYKTGITRFSDLTKQEFIKAYSNIEVDNLLIEGFNSKKHHSFQSAPSEWDWREHGYNFPDRDQGSCGSNWAFITMDQLQFIYYRSKGVMREFSVQQLIDCDTLDSGCNGGTIINALTWLKSNGIMLESDYPYTGRKSTCKQDSTKYIDMKVTGYKKLGSSYSTYSPVDEMEMAEFLYETGPLIVGINGKPLSTYTGGIIDVSSSECPSSGINIFAVLVGYGYDSATGKYYWIVQNSWGKSWGENGYFRIKRGSGTCGINCYVITPLVSF